MSRIEPPDQTPMPGLTGRIADFWSRNVNAERLNGAAVSRQPRGSDAYFAEIEAQRYRSHRHLLPWIERIPPGSRVLEVGCGIGLDSFTMARRGVDVTAVDLTLVGARTANERSARHAMTARYAVAEGGALPFADESFDHVYSFGVLHHAADTQRCVDEVHRVLRRGGDAWVMLYHRRSLNELVHRMVGVPFEERDELCPVVRRFTRAESRRLFGRYSRVEVEADYLFGEGYGMVYRLFPDVLYRPLSRVFGWHLMIRATK